MTVFDVLSIHRYREALSYPYPCQFGEFASVSRPWEGVPFQAFCPETKAGLIPVEDFDEPSRCTTEYKVTAIKGAFRFMVLY